LDLIIPLLLMRWRLREKSMVEMTAWRWTGTGVRYWALAGFLLLMATSFLANPRLVHPVGVSQILVVGQLWKAFVPCLKSITTSIGCGKSSPRWARVASSASQACSHWPASLQQFQDCAANLRAALVLQLVTATS
jgi:hypothetical protein